MMGAAGANGLNVQSAVDHVISLPGVSISSIPESSLTALPPGTTTRRVMALRAVLRAGSAESTAIVGVLQAAISPTAVSGMYAVTVWDPATGAEFPGSGLDVVHLDAASFFSQ